MLNTDNSFAFAIRLLKNNNNIKIMFAVSSGFRPQMQFIKLN